MPRLSEDQHAHLTATVDRWLTKNYRQAIDLPALAREVGISRFLLCRLYRERTGKSIRLKQREIRIDHAARLLSDGTRKVGTVARAVGYGSVSHFTKAFAEEKGMLPSEWRNRPRAVPFPETSGNLPPPGLFLTRGTIGEVPPEISYGSGRWIAGWSGSVPPRRVAPAAGRWQEANAFLD